jgi:hypothetical protein
MKRLIVTVIVAIALCFAGVAVAAKAYTPSTNDQFDLGTDKLQYKDVRAAGSIILEGATHNAYETTISVTDPTADRTVTLQDASGTVMYTTDAFAGALADTQLYIGQSTGLGAAKAMSGDVTITNAGVTTIGANKINVGKAFLNEVTLTVAAGTSTNTATVDSGHKLMGTYISTLGSLNTASFANLPLYDGTNTWTMSLNAVVGPNPVTFTLIFLSDN